MKNARVVASVKGLVEEFLNGDDIGKAMASRALSGYASALMDMGHVMEASEVAGMVTTLIEHELEQR